MADSKEDTQVVTQEANGEVKPPSEASSSKSTTDSEGESPSVPSESFEENRQEAKEGSDKDGKDGATPKASDGLGGVQEDTTTSNDSNSSKETKEHKESSVEEDVEKKDNKVDKEEVKKEPPAEGDSVDSKDPAPSTEKEAETPKLEKVVQSTADETTIPKKVTGVVMRDKNPSPQTNGETGKDPRVSMDDCIQEVKKTGRASLQMSESPFDGINFNTQKTPHLETVLEKLSYVEGRVGKVDDRYIVPRDGITSFVFLAKK